MQDGADPNARRDYGPYSLLAPIHVATLHGSTAAAKLLLNIGADIALTCDHWSKYGSHTIDDAMHESHRSWSTLHLAVEVADIDMLHDLCSRGLNVDIRTALGMTPLHYAALIASELSYTPDHSRFLLTISALLANGGDANARDYRGQTPLFFATRMGGSVEAIKLLLDAGADINASDEGGQNALFWADDDVVELLLQRGIDHRVQDKRGWTALSCARIAGIHATKVALLESWRR